MNENLLYPILGFLKMGPKTGYDIKHLSNETISHFWKYSFGQIYPCLKKLEQRRLVRKEKITVGTRAKYVYSITAGGEKALEDWLSAKAPNEDIRVPFLLKLFFCSEGGENLKLQLESFLDEVETKIAALLNVKQGLEDSRNRGDILEYLDQGLLSVDYGIAVNQAKASWLKKQLQILLNLKNKDK